MNRRALSLTIFDGNHEARTIRLDSFPNNIVRFGRAEDNDIVFFSRMISRHHGVLEYGDQGWIIRDLGSTNGLFLNRERIRSVPLSPNMRFQVEDEEDPDEGNVCILVSLPEEGDRWGVLDLQSCNREVTIGRNEACDIHLPYPIVSRLHARVFRRSDGYYIQDVSTNGTTINGEPVKEIRRLKEKDMILIANTRLVYSAGKLYWLHMAKGISVNAIDIVKTVKSGRGTKNIANHITLSIDPGDFVAIIGGSGAGKSTFMNCISGFGRATSGTVLINGESLYPNYDTLKSVIGYVPQQDIVYDDLTLETMLLYAAKLRMPDDTSAAEQAERVRQVLSMVELTGHEKTMIHRLSGGQKKRASIAVELLADPKLFFLDEPTSGLDPGTERNLMHTLKKMTEEGRTIILVTHNTLNLQLCDKLVILGRGGNLCFCGTPEDAETFFREKNLVDIYYKLDNESRQWSEMYYQSHWFRGIRQQETASGTASLSKAHRPSIPRQTSILCGRYFRLIFNDRKRLFMLLAQAILLAGLVYLVADKELLFAQYDHTKAILFALACSSFWIGVLNAIQEICKERVILQREYSATLSLLAYVLSKFIVLGIFCMVQSLLLIGTFSLLAGCNAESLILPPFGEMLVTIYLSMLSAMGMGLLTSALCPNPDRAMSLAPVLLMPQILFSGLAFKLEGFVEKISYAITCRWSIEALGTGVDLNAMTLELQTQVPTFPHEHEEIFNHTAAHLWTTWAILAGTVVIFALGAIYAAKVSLKKKR